MARQRYALIWSSLQLGLLAAQTVPVKPPVAVESGTPLDWTEQPETGGVLVAEHGRCEGYDELWSTCHGPPCSGECMPQDCVLGQWQDWESEGGCTGLVFRMRTIKTPSNECGRPCRDETQQSRIELLKQCVIPAVDCSFKSWVEWSPCATTHDQQDRKRQVATVATNGGKPCEGETEETKPCHQGALVEDCVMGAWAAWNVCTGTCGKAVQFRHRAITSNNKNGGAPCKGSTYMQQTCPGLPICPKKDCQLSEWGKWGSCDATTQPQSSRARNVIQPSSGGGVACAGDLKETKGCEAEPGARQDCEFSPWSGWDPCDKACDVGQKKRQRTLLSAQFNGGVCERAALTETEKCNLQVCHEGKMDCMLGDWTPWGVCSTDCGDGVSKRQRIVEKKAVAGGFGCQGPLAEMQPCSGVVCKTVNCKWGDWDDWSSCSCTCGGGSMRRSRFVASPPLNGGSLCGAEDKSVIAACATQACPSGCIDGQWGAWSDWNPNSATCVGAYKSRARQQIVGPNHCGKPALGEDKEFMLASALPDCIPDQECEVSQWSSWSQCSCTCFGVQERVREIAQSARGRAEPCNETLKESQPCNPNPAKNEKEDDKCSDIPHIDCVMADWHGWGNCTRDCGRGQKTRQRSIHVTSSGGGEPCTDTTQETGPCNTQPCTEVTCKDCKWSEWDQWSDCTRCGGQRYRQRFITQMPNECGAYCKPDDAKEVGSCALECEPPRYCTFGAWSEPSCGASCRNTTAIMSRPLILTADKPLDDDMLLFKGLQGSRCVGSYMKLDECPYNHQDLKCDTCTRQNCEFNNWNEWSAGDCTGLCERSRTIKTANNQCGDPCNGPMIETKYCQPDCNVKVDCGMSNWESWSACSSALDQKVRRRVIKQPPQNGGENCRGVLLETQSCGHAHEEEMKNCALTEWSEWGHRDANGRMLACSRTCGDGYVTRKRIISEEAVQPGECQHNDLTEVKICRLTSCSDAAKPCEWGEWSEWHPCQESQKTRSRSIVQDATEDGETCKGGMEETKPCGGTGVQDCEMTEWSTWESCDKTCGGGQKYRHRSIMKFPDNGGSDCPGDLHKTEGCNEIACGADDCEVGDWNPWEACQSDCGVGQRARSRKVVHNRDAGGLGCTSHLEETEGCTNTACFAIDCKWANWNSWSACSCTCGGGMRARSREISDAPQGGGKMCGAEDKEEVEPCNAFTCDSEESQNGQWAQWTDFSPCTTSCEGGTQFRTRAIAVMAKGDGKAVDGKDREMQFCNVDTSCSVAVDCEFADWAVWSDCSCTCNGVKRRGRRIARYGRGDGLYCIGDLKQNAPCNPSEGDVAPLSCKVGLPVDGSFSEWTPWTDCSKTCNGGQKTRSRDIGIPPANGGKPISGNTQEIRECKRTTCPDDANNGMMDCKFGEWEQWGACSKCSGQKKRFRTIITYAKDGGRNCEPIDHEETLGCDHRSCHEKDYCIWSLWEAWSGCSVKCGAGRKSRVRRLKFSTTPPKVTSPALISEYQAMMKLGEKTKSTSLQELTVAFVLGSFAFFLASAVIRGLSRRAAVGAGDIESVLESNEE